MENLHMEYKENFPKQKNDKIYETLIKEIIAFLNSSGGTLKVGIADNGDIVGIEYEMDHVEKIMESIITNISPSPRTNIDYIIKPEGSKNILYIYINEGARKVYYNKAKGKCEAGAFYRSGTSAIGLSQEEIEDIEQQKFISSFDLKSPLQPLTFNELCKRANMTLDSVINEFELSNEKLGFNYSAFLLSDQNYHEIDIYTFSGTSRSNPISNKKIKNAPLFIQFDSIMSYLENINHNIILEMKSVREEQELYDIEIVREIIINAIVHNDYSQKDTIKIHIFSDRIEVHNRVEEKHINSTWFLKQSRVVNASLFKCLKRLNIIEGQGIGCDKILNKYGSKSFHVDKTDCSIALIIPKNQGEEDKNLSEEEKVLVEIAKGNNTSSQMLENLSFGKTKLSKILNKMIEEKMIQRIGSGKYTHYEINR